MKKFICVLLPVIMTLTACGTDESAREPVPSLEPAAPRTVTRSTYTGTTVDFIAATTTPSPSMGRDPNDIETGDTADGYYRSTETGAAADGYGSPETVTGDTSEGRPENDPETAVTNGDNADTYHDTADRADNEIFYEGLVSDTNDTSDRRYD